MTLINIYDRVAMWNAARYPRELNKALLIALLREEYKEFLEAKTDVDKIDALCDLIFVAYGGIWKDKQSEELLNSLSKGALQYTDTQTESSPMSPVCSVAAWLDYYEYGPEMPATFVCFPIVYLALSQLFTEGFSMDQALQALNIVCDANDSKIVVLTDPSIKANLDKGTGFKPPEPALIKLIQEVRNARE